MDLALYFQVLRRFRFLALAGLTLAVALAVLATAKLSFAGGKPTFTYRQAEVYTAQTTLFITQKGFPWGSTVPEYTPTNPSTGKPATPLADPNRLSTLTTLYAQLATGDSVHRTLLRQGAPDGVVSVTAVPAPAYSSPAILPLLTLSASADTAPGAVALANLASRAFQGWLLRQQVEAGIPPDRRVVVEIVHHAQGAALAASRGKTLPAIVFLTVLMATLGLILVLENLRPRTRAVPSQKITAATERRSA